jgi:hypothetical protein
MDILVFATNVEKPRQVSRIKPLLTAVSEIIHWNFDLEDCDKILRVEVNGLSPCHIQTLLNTAGFECHELE